MLVRLVACFCGDLPETLLWLNAGDERYGEIGSTTLHTRECIYNIHIDTYAGGMQMTDTVMEWHAIIVINSERTKKQIQI